MSDTSTALTPVTPTLAKTALEPTNSREALELSKILFTSRLLPRSITSVEAAFTIVVTGRELGLTAMQSLRSIRVIDGSPTMSADLMVALVKRARECEYFQLIESTPDIATYETKRHGSLSPTRMSFTIDEAREAQLTGKDNWKKYRAAMLRARASAALCRVEYPDLMLGIYETDELDSGEDYSRPAAADTPGLECGPADRLHSFDAMIRPAKKTMDPELNVIPEPQEFQELTAHVDEAAQLSERILAAASVEELSAVGKAISEALSSKRISQKNRFDLMGLYRSHRKQITNPSTPEMDTIEVAQ